jgi:hypothetical protein
MFSIPAPVARRALLLSFGGGIAHMDMILGMIPVLLFDAALAFLARVLSSRAIVRFMAWWFIPLVLGFLMLGPSNLINARGESSTLWLAFGYTVMAGCVASGVGTLLRYLVRRLMKSQV